MKKKMKVFDFMDTYNMIVGGIVALLSCILGEYWYLFAFFLLFNVIDWITGWLKSNLQHKTNSQKGWTGVLKKLGYWLMIMLAFSMSTCFISIGKIIGIDLGLTTLLGWFVLASLMVNEVRSITENFVEAGYHVPVFLTKGLAVAENLIQHHKKAGDQ